MDKKSVKVIGLMIISAVTTVLTLVGLMFLFDLEVVERPADEEAVVNENEAPVERVVVNHEEAQMDAIDAVAEAIVGVVRTSGGFDGFLGDLGGTPTDSGSGIVYDVRDGDTYIVTNEHVINGATSVGIVFNDEAQTRVDATVVGSDVYTDIAVLRVENFEAEVVAEFGRTEDLRLGQTVIAIGNPLGQEFAGSTTMGVVSGRDRSVSIPITSTNGQYQNWPMTVLQTDAAVNPGNSGGALINLAGEVVGINSMKLVQSAIEGMSFSIPSYIALPIIEELETHGKITRPLLGVSLVDIGYVPANIRAEINLPEDITAGVLVNEVVVGSMAEEMGIEAGDVLTHIGDAEVSNSIAFRQELFTYREGDVLTLTVIRDGLELELDGEVMINNEVVQ